MQGGTIELDTVDKVACSYIGIGYIGTYIRQGALLVTSFAMLKGFQIIMDCLRVVADTSEFVAQYVVILHQ